MEEFLTETVSAAMHLRNRTVTSSQVEKTPYELWTDKNQKFLQKTSATAKDDFKIPDLEMTFCRQLLNDSRDSTARVNGNRSH